MAGPPARQTTKLAIGPLNVAGQAYQWAEATRTFLGIEALSFAGSRARARRLDGPSHTRVLHHRVRPAFLNRLAVGRALDEVTHLVVESFTTLLGDQRRETLPADLSWLGGKGIRVGAVFHGSDIRSPSAHVERNSNSYFHLMTNQQVASLERSTAAVRAAAIDSGLPLFVSTPDLLLDLPTATWLPLVIDMRTWETPVPALSSGKIRVLHIPSRRIPPIKGTSHIDPVLRSLEAAGVLEYVAPEGVRHEQMPDIVKSVDVVIDQILTGSYGVAATEAMAAGRLVIGGVDRQVRSMIDGDVPILDSNTAELEHLLRDICQQPARYEAQASAGVEYVRRIHSGKRSAEALRSFLSTTAGWRT